MTQQRAHAMLPRATHDELARQAFVQSLKVHLASEVSPGNKRVYEQSVKPQIEAALQRAPRDRHDVRPLMKRQPYYQMWSSLQRTSQEMMWDSVSSSVDRQIDTLIDAARQQPASLGSLTLDPAMPIPSYHQAVDIHCQPGGYHTELCRDDVAAGAIYDRAVHVYAMGRMGDLNDDLGASAVAWLKRNRPDFKPRRILDMGCSVGHSTLPYVDAYPDAEVHAIDVGAPMLRYAHARAESLGKRVHFSQQNAEQTNFESGSFDLVVSHILLHETSGRAIPRIMKEIHRLLSPGGTMLHAEVPQYEGMDPYDAFMLDWDTYNNNEPFWGAVHDMDLVKLSTDAGFAADQVFQVMTPSAIEEAQSRTQLLQGGDFAGAGVWFLYGALKAPAAAA
jgi:ubiquinone/menaquinone biosynthesis C-methylase UbiE